MTPMRGALLAGVQQVSGSLRRLVRAASAATDGVPGHANPHRSHSTRTGSTSVCLWAACRLTIDPGRDTLFQPSPFPRALSARRIRADRANSGSG